MGRFDGWLFVSDIDGTLLSAPDYTLSQENRRAISEFVSEGGHFTFASGRCLFGLLDLYRELDLKDPLIAGNGALIYDPVSDRFLSVSEMNKEKSLEIYRYVKERLPEVGFEIFTDRKIYFIDDNESVQHHIHAENLPYPFVSLDEAIGPWTKLVFGIIPSRMAESRKVVFSAPCAEEFYIAQGGEWYLELSDKSISKGVAILELANHLDISKEKIITLGDNENDISMFEITPYSFAVADATKKAKNAAAFQTQIGGSKGSAIADVIKQF